MMTTDKKVFLAKIRDVDDAKAVIQEVIDRYNQAFKSGNVARYGNELLPAGWRKDVWMQSLREDLHKDRNVGRLGNMLDDALDFFTPDEVNKFSAVWKTGYRRRQSITEGYSRIVSACKTILAERG